MITSSKLTPRLAQYSPRTRDWRSPSSVRRSESSENAAACPCRTTMSWLMARSLHGSARQRHANFLAAVGVWTQLEHAVQRNRQTRALLGRNAVKVSVDGAQHGLVRDHQHRPARALELDDH